MAKYAANAFHATKERLRERSRQLQQGSRQVLAEGVHPPEELVPLLLQ